MSKTINQITPIPDSANDNLNGGNTEKYRQIFPLAGVKKPTVTDDFLLDRYSPTRGRKAIEYASKIDPTQIVITEHPSKIVSWDASEHTVKSVIRIAQNKEWSSITVKGTRTFKKAVWLEASLQGMEVSGYKPTEQDLDQLSVLKQRTSQNVNQIEKLADEFSKQLSEDKSISVEDKKSLKSMFHKHMESLSAKGLIKSNLMPETNSIETTAKASKSAESSKKKASSRKKAQASYKHNAKDQGRTR